MDLLITLVIAIIIVAVLLYVIDALVTDPKANKLFKVLVVVLVAVYVVNVLAGGRFNILSR